ncbi:ROK family protein, partial [bacterium]|nr:ROK family protein [bacterium]
MAEKIFCGVDLGGTATKIALGRASGELLVESEIPTRSQDGPAGVLGRIADEVLRLTGEASVKPEALGMAAPGTLDIAHGIVKYFPNFPGHWPDVPIRGILQAQIGCPVYILNDVRTATLGELDYGRGRDVDSMVFMAIGTGLGGGVVIDRQLRLGRIGSAGELGHMIMQPDGRLCGCGARGCLETLVSGPALAGEGVRLLLSGQAPHLYE